MAFMEKSLETNTNSNSEAIRADFKSPSENIIMKLKHLRNKSYFQNDIEAMQDFDWLVNFKLLI